MKHAKDLFGENSNSQDGEENDAAKTKIMNVEESKAAKRKDRNNKMEIGLTKRADERIISGTVVVEDNQG